jgi:hypothetical protein
VGEAPREVGGGHLRGLELVAGHRARPVDHERDVQGAALGGGGLGCGDLEEAVDAMLALDGEELVVEAHAGECSFPRRSVVSGAETFRGPTARCDVAHSTERV